MFDLSKLVLREIPVKNLIVTLTGPSCAGKSTLEAMLKARGFENVISTTTRHCVWQAGDVGGKGNPAMIMKTAQIC